MKQAALGVLMLLVVAAALVFASVSPTHKTPAASSPTRVAPSVTPIPVPRPVTPSPSSEISLPPTPVPSTAATLAKLEGHPVLPGEPIPVAVKTDGDYLYVVQDWDNLTFIADEFGTTVGAMVAANPAAIKDPNLIYIGEALVIPNE